MRKTLLALLLLIVTVAVFIGCGGSDETKEAEETATMPSDVIESPTTTRPSRVTSEETSITERYEEPLAPTDGYEVINLEKIYTPVWSEETTLPRLIRTYEEFNALALSDIFQPDADFSFETHSLVVVEFQFVGSEKMVEFYGFDVVDGKVSPIFTVERVDPPTEGIYRRLVLISVPASNIAGEMGEIFVVNLTYPGAGSHYYHSYVHADTMVDETQPLAPTKFGSYIPLGDEAFENWDYTKQAVLVRSWDEFYALKPTKDINDWYYGFSFDHSVMIIAAFTHHSEERITDFYGFDVVDGKICTILTVDTPTDPNAAIPDDIRSSFVLITVAPDSIAGEMGEVLVVVNGHNGYKSQHHNGYMTKAPSKVDWYKKIGSMPDKNWSYNGTFLVRSKAELDSLGLNVSFDDSTLSFENSWLVLAKFNLASSDENVDFYGFDIKDGLICPIISVEAPRDYHYQDMTKIWFVVCIPKGSLIGQFGAGLALNTLNPGSGSAYHLAYVPEA